MGSEKQFIPERLVVGVLSSDESAEAMARESLVAHYGPLCMQTAKERFSVDHVL